MQLSEIYRGSGQAAFTEIVRSISIGKLKTYQLYDRMKVRLHVAKLNSENLKKIAPRLWERINENDDALATELGQAILVSHLDMIVAALNVLGIPHEDGFFAKDLDPAPYFTEGWQQRVLDALRGKFPESLIVFYINHLAWELGKLTEVFVPAAQTAAH